MKTWAVNNTLWLVWTLVFTEEVSVSCVAGLGAVAEKVTASIY